MRPLVRHLAVVVAVLLLGGGLSAQPPGGPFGPGMGGPIEKSAAFGPLAHKTIQDELKLDDAQKEKLSKIPDEVRGQHKDELATLTQKAKDSAAESAKFIERIQKEFADAEAKVLKPEQQARLRQLEVQLLASNAFNDPEIAAALKLTDKQKMEMKMLQEGMFEAEQKVFEEVSKEIDRTDREKFRAEYLKRTNKIETDFLAKMADSLDADQKAAWKKMTGEPSAAIPLPVVAPAGPGGFRQTGLQRIMPLRLTMKVRLLQAPGVAKDLKLSEEEADKLKAIPKDMESKFGDEAQKIAQEQNRGWFDLPQLEQRMAEEARKRALADVLKPEQEKRLRQLERQRQGFTVFQNIEVLEALKLTPAQAELVEESSADLFKGGPGGPGPNPGPTAKAIAAVVDKFDAGQKKTWADLFGEPFDFSKVKGLPPDTSLQRGFGPGTAMVSPSSSYSMHAVMLLRKGDQAPALAAFDEAIRLGPKNAIGYNGKAYLLATSFDEKLRDGKKAVELAKKALELETDNPNHFNTLDTLACAYAEAGDFENAVKVLEEAMTKAPPFYKEEGEMKMKLFREKKAYHEEPPKK